jgi:hypothetical protein
MTGGEAAGGGSGPCLSEASSYLGRGKPYANDGEPESEGVEQSARGRKRARRPGVKKRPSARIRPEALCGTTGLGAGAGDANESV